MTKTLLNILVFISTISIAVGQSSFYDRLADSALTLTKQIVRYDPTYFRLDYPNGDVPKDKGVCTDVVIRAYRKLKIDLQKEVHEDMKLHFSKYPKKWGLSEPDKNIDHRRVPRYRANPFEWYFVFFLASPATTRILSCGIYAGVKSCSRPLACAHTSAPEREVFVLIPKSGGFRERGLYPKSFNYTHSPNEV